MAHGQAGYDEHWGRGTHLLGACLEVKVRRVWRTARTASKRLRTADGSHIRVAICSPWAVMGAIPCRETVWLIVSVHGLYRTNSKSQPGPAQQTAEFSWKGDEPTRESVDRTNPTGNTQTARFWCFLVGLLVSCPAVPINNQEAHGFPHNGSSSNGAARCYLVGGVGDWPSFTPGFVGPGKILSADR